MCEIRNIKSEIMFPVIEEIMNKGVRVRITVTGMSMYPFLRENKDSVELSEIDFARIRIGDILLIQMESGQYILHRVIRKKRRSFYLNGDAQKTIEGPLKPEQIIAKAEAVWRENRYIACSDIRWRILSFLWRMLFPVRYLIIQIYWKISRSFIGNYIRRIIS